MLYIKALITTCKLSSRRVIFWVGLLIGFLYLMRLFTYFVFSSENFGVGNALTMSSYIIQAAIIIFMMLGIYLIRLDDTVKLDFFIKNSNSLVYRIIGKIVFLFILVLCICGISLLTFYIFLYLRGITSLSFYYLSFKYIFLYWGSSILIGYLIGMLLGLWIKNTFVYFIVIPLAFLLGPLNSMIISKENFAHFLNIGQQDYNFFYHPMYGFSLENFQYAKRALIILILMLLLTLTINIKINTIKSFFIIIYMLSIVGIYYCLIILNQPEQIVRFNPDHGSALYKELSYYKKEQVTPEKQNLEVQSYDIELDTNGILYAKVKMDILNRDLKKKDIWLTLYHGFEVKNISINQKRVHFNQVNDAIYIESGYLSDKFSMEIEYEGYSSPLFFANRQAIYLPSYFPWLPSINVKPPITIYEDMFHRNMIVQPQKSNYKLIYKGKNKIYTNVNETSKNIFQGKAQGLTIIAGDLIKKNIDGVDVILPSSWQLSLTNYVKFREKIEEVMKNVNRNIGYNHQIPKKIMILPKTVIYDSLYEDNAWIFKDHLIIHYPVYSNQDETGLIKEEHLVFSLIDALTQKKTEKYHNNLEIPILFNAIYGYSYLSENMGHNIPYYQFIKEKYGNNNPNKLEVLNQIEKVVNSQNKKVQSSFLKEWHDILMTQESFNWLDLKKLVFKYTNGGENNANNKESYQEVP